MIRKRKLQRKEVVVSEEEEEVEVVVSEVEEVVVEVQRHPLLRLTPQRAAWGPPFVFRR